MWAAGVPSFPRVNPDKPLSTTIFLSSSNEYFDSHKADNKKWKNKENKKQHKKKKFRACVATLENKLEANKIKHVYIAELKNTRNENGMIVSLYEISDNWFFRLFRIQNLPQVAN